MCIEWAYDNKYLLSYRKESLSIYEVTIREKRHYENQPSWYLTEDTPYDAILNACYSLVKNNFIEIPEVIHEETTFQSSHI